MVWPLSLLHHTGNAPLTLPDGVTITLARDSCAYELGHFLGDSSDRSLPRVFVLDHLSFNPGSADLDNKSRETILDLSAVLASFPLAKMRLEGHTDDTGDPEENKRLSLKRAEAVKSILTQASVDPTRVDTTGWGSERPIATNETAEGRASNRRLQLVVLEK